MLVSCSEGGYFDPEKNDPIDRQLDLSRDDYRNLISPEKIKGNRSAATTNDLAPKIPDIAPILAAPRPPKIGQTQLVSITVTDDVPLKDVLLELARLADVDIEVDAGIEGGITFRAKDKPFNEVIARIADLGGLRYKITNGVLRVERDIPYVKNYSVDFLNMVRSSQSNINVATDILAISGAASAGSGGGGGAEGGAAAGGGGGGSTGFSTGSASTITATAEGDFWASLENGVREILRYEPPQRMSAGATAAAQQLQQSAAASGASAEGELPQGTFLVINRQAGVISVACSERQHEMIARFMEELRRNASAQVLIEAKILEVQLNEQYQSGVNWNLFEGAVKYDGDYQAASIPTGSGTAFTFSPGGGADVRLDYFVQILESFGTVRTLSSPRLHAVNNQQAVLTFAQNRTFFEVTIDQEDAQFDPTTGQQTQQGSTNISSERLSVPIGIILTLIPSIDLKNHLVTLNVRPTLSREVGQVTDPGSALLNAQILANDASAPTFVNQVPVVEVRELDSILKVKSGGVMVIGGLMQQDSTNTDTGLPLISEVPWIGNAFKGTDKSSNVRELVIFIRATIVNPEGNYNDADKQIYENFTRDPRKLEF